MDLDYVVDVCKQYEEIRKKAQYGYGNSPTDYIETAKKLKALGWEWGHRLNYDHFRIRENYYITNSATHYKPKKGEYFIEWDNGNVGAYQFVGDFGYPLVQDEFKEFEQKLMSYNPVDYDPYNCHIVYDVENGKRLIEDYPQLLIETKAKMQKKIKAAELEQAKKKYEKLLAEAE